MADARTGKKGMTTYTPWHVARLRERLDLYRNMAGENGRPLAWHRLAEKLRDFEGAAFRAAEPSKEVLAEALRRFNDGKHVLRTERLDALATFLKGAGFFYDADIKETGGGYELALAMLAQTGGPSRDGPPVSYGIYTGAVRHGPTGNVVSTLELLQGDDPALIPFRETIEYSPSAKLPEQPFHPGAPKRFAGYRVEFRDGWFVRRNPDDALALVEARHHDPEQVIYFLPHIPTDALSSPMLVLMKLDRFVPPASPLPDIPPADLMPAALSQWARDRAWRYVRRGSSAEKSLRSEEPDDGRRPHGFAPRDDAIGMIELTMGLIEAARYGFADRVEYLLSTGADINMTEPGTGSTALHYAAANNAIGTLRVLAAHKDCDFRISDARGRTAATLAIEVGENPVTGRFLRAKEMAQHRAFGTVPVHPSAYRPAKA